MKQEARGSNVEREAQRVLLHIVKRKNKWQGKAVNFANQEECKFKSFKEFLGWLEETGNKHEL